MNLADDVGLCQREHVIAAIFVQMILLDHRSHRTVEQEDLLLIKCGSRLSIIHSQLYTIDDVLHLTVGLVLRLIFLDNAQGLFYFPLVMEVHLDMYAFATDVVEEGFQFVEGHPTGHDTLTAGKDLLIKIIPLR